MVVKFNGKIDHVYTNLNDKFEALNTYGKKVGKLRWFRLVKL